MGNESSAHQQRTSGVAPVTFSNTEAPEQYGVLAGPAERDAVTKSPFTAEGVAAGLAAD